MESQNYSLGRGKVYLARFAPGTQTPGPYLYIGNTPEFSFTIETTDLDHFNSDEGIREKDDSISLEVNRTGGFTTDSIRPNNLAMYLFGTVADVALTPVTDKTYDILLAKPKAHYLVGQTDANPAGDRGLTLASFEVRNGANVLTAGVDYDIDVATGMLYIREGGVLDGTKNATLEYNIPAQTRTRIVSGDQPIEGSLIYISTNPKGHKYHYSMPWVKVKPNGDMNLKGDEWQTIPFNIDILKKSTAHAIMLDGARYAI